MTDNRAPREKRQQPGSAGKEKKLYQKPAFRYERSLDMLAHAKRVRVRPLVGPSSILLAVMASGLNGQSFAQAFSNTYWQLWSGATSRIMARSLRRREPC